MLRSPPFKAFLLSRTILFIIIYATLVFLPVRNGKGFWRGFPNNRFLDGWARFDSGWYAGIAKNGYKNIPTGKGQDTNFFPMYPILMRVVGKVTGDVFLAGIIVSNIFFLFALFGLYKLVLTKYGPNIAEKTVYVLAFNPFSFYFSAAYAEAVFLFFLIFAFYFCERERYLLAALFAAGAGATRNLGIFAFVGTGLVAFQKAGYDWRRLKRKMFYLIVGMSGSLAYMMCLGIRFHDPFLFIHAQHAWGPFFQLNIFTDIYKNLLLGSLAPWKQAILVFFHIFLGVFTLLLLWKGRKALPLPYLIFSILLIIPGFMRLNKFGALSDGSIPHLHLTC